jgi:cyclophilin family peptidyl-prolyl cis-trans isomerase
MRKLGIVGAAVFVLAVACKGPQGGASADGKPLAAKPAAAAASSNVKVVLDTSFGDVEVELYRDKAPKGVANFLRYADEKLYDGTVFHRIVRGFVVQGGGFDPDLTRRKTYEPLGNEADNGLKNERGTIAWARTPDPHSATNQFYVNLKDNPALDHRDKSPAGWGYAVFGRVVRGLEIFDKLSEVPTRPNGPHASFPAEPVLLRAVKVLTR